MQILNDQSRGTAATVADTSTANLGTPFLEDRGQSGDDTGTGAAKRVADGDGAAIDVDLAGVEVQELHVGEGNDGEGLVDLVKVNVLVGETGVLDSLGDGQGGSNGEALGLARSVTPSEDLGNGLEAELLDFGLRHED